MDANKSIEQRIEELESLVYASKNVLSFDEASKFLSLSKSYLYGRSHSTLQASGQDDLFREEHPRRMVTSEPGQDSSTDCL